MTDAENLKKARPYNIEKMYTITLINPNYGVNKLIGKWIKWKMGSNHYPKPV